MRDGRLYVQVTTAEAPDGAIRGQLIAPDFATLYRSAATPNQTVPPSVWTGSASVAATVTADNRASFHFDAGNESAERVTLRRGAAGAAGTDVDSLAQDANDLHRWSLTDYTLTAELGNALLAGRLFVEAEADGRTRAQLLPADVTVLRGLMTGDAVVPRAPRGASAVAAMTLRGNNAEFNVTLPQMPADVAVRVASAGRTGVDLLTLSPVADTPDLWRLQEALPADVLEAALSSGLYVETAEPAQRAQLVAPNAPVVVAEINARQAGSDASGRGTGAITVQADGSFELVARLEGLVASQVTLNAGPVGINGDPALSLTAEGAGVWSASGVLSDAQRELLASGDLYLAVTVGGSLELRGQLRAASDMPPGLLLP